VRIERGVLSKWWQDTEFYRNNNIAIEEPLGIRVVGHESLIPRSTKRSTPEIRMRSIRGPHACGAAAGELAEEARKIGRQGLGGGVTG
jgi:hypothetical protein